MASRRVVAETCDAGPDTNTHSDEPAHDGHTVTPTSDVEVHVGRESVHSHENASDAALAKAEEVTEVCDACAIDTVIFFVHEEL